MLFRSHPTYGFDVFGIDVELEELGAGLVDAGHHRVQQLQRVLLHPTRGRVSRLPSSNLLNTLPCQYVGSVFISYGSGLSRSSFFLFLA